MFNEVASSTSNIDKSSYANGNYIVLLFCLLKFNVKAKPLKNDVFSSPKYVCI